MVKLEKVKKQYKDFELDCSMEIKEGWITGLVGQNGAGKSTAFKAMLGLIRSDSGKIEILGKTPELLGKEEREQIGVVMAGSGFNGYLSINDLIPIFDAMYQKFDKAWFLKECEKFKLPLKKKIKEFSTGMNRKLQILAALSHDAKLLILDEPTAGLDVVAREQILNMLREYMETPGRSILISSHISSDLEGFCDDLYMIDNGKIVLHEETDRLLEEYGVLKVSKEQYQGLDHTYILKKLKDTFGYRCLTDQKQFYQENYPGIVIEKGNIDELIIIMIQGEKI